MKDTSVTQPKITVQVLLLNRIESCVLTHSRASSSSHTCKNSQDSSFLSDLQAFKMVHESSRAEMDRAHFVYRAHLRVLFLGQFAVLQQGKLLHLLFCDPRLLWSVRHLQFFEPLLRVFGRRREHNERNSWETDT